MSHNILLATWSDASKAYENFTKLKNSQIVNINQAVIIERLENGSFKIVDHDGSLDPNDNTWTGGLFGSLIGILGGPLGILLGFTTGSLLGSLADSNTELSQAAVLSKISTSLPVGSTALFIDVNETDEKIADNYFKENNAVVYRWDYDDVESEIEASVGTWEEINRLANSALQEQKKEENKAKRKEKWNSFKAKFKN